MILWLLFILLLTWIVNYRVKRRRMYELASLIPAVKDELPLIGVAKAISGNTEDIMEMMKKYSYDAIEHNGIVRGWFGPLLYFVATDPVDLEMILKTCLEKDDGHRFLRVITGFGSVFAPVSIWRKRRKFTVPVFSPKNLQNFVGILSEQSEKLAKILESKVNEGPFSIWPFLSRFTLDSICETTMAVKINAQENSASPFLDSINQISHLVCERMFHLWLHPDWIFKLFPQYKDQEKCIYIIQNFVDEVIQKRRSELEIVNQGITEADNSYNLDDYKKKSFLDLLIFTSGGKKGWTNTELREEVLTFVIGGMETSAITVGTVMKLLAKYPEVQVKIYDELYQVFGDSDRPLVKDDLTKLKYMEQVIKEALRLFPPAPIVIRKVLEEITLPSGRMLPAGSGVVCSIWGVHRDPRYWGLNAEHFDPDRFLSEKFNLTHACSYMPFSNGPRNCVGYQYAMMAVKTALTAILRRYKVVEDREPSPIPHFKVKIDIVMKAVDGYEVALERRMVDKNILNS